MVRPYMFHQSKLVIINCYSLQLQCKVASLDERSAEAMEVSFVFERLLLHLAKYLLVDITTKQTYAVCTSEERVNLF